MACHLLVMESMILANFLLGNRPCIGYNFKVSQNKLNRKFLLALFFTHPCFFMCSIAFRFLQLIIAFLLLQWKPLSQTWILVHRSFFCKWIYNIVMSHYTSHVKIHRHQPNILAMRVFSNLRNNNVVTMETSGLSPFSHRPSSFLPSLVPIGP